MAVTRVTGNPNYSNTGADASSRYIPEIWSGKLLEKFYTTTFYQEISNSDYVADIKNMGDKVYIRTVPSITTRSFQKGQKLVYENPDSADTEFTVDYATYFAFKVDDVDKAQSDINIVNGFSTDAAEQMKIDIDSTIWAAVYDDMSAYNTGLISGAKTLSFNLGTSSAPVQLTKSNVLEYITDAMSVLDEQNIPQTDRWMIMHPWVKNLIMKSDIKDVSLTGDTVSPLRNGKIGNIGGFNVYVSNNLYYVDSSPDYYYLMFGHKSALCYASQLTENEALRSTETFATYVRGLMVYGFKVIQPTALGTIICKK